MDIALPPRLFNLRNLYSASTVARKWVKVPKMGIVRVGGSGVVDRRG
jgi:hypothetical protein